MRARSRSVLVLLVAPLIDCATAPDAPAPNTGEAPREVEAMLATARPLETRGGLRLSTASAGSSPWIGETITVDAPASGDAPLRISANDREGALVVRRLGAKPSKARVDDRLLRYDEVAAGVDAILFARDTEIEELLVVRKRGGELGYAVELPKDWSASSRDDATVSITSKDGAPRFSLRAAKAWDRTGNVVPVRMATAVASGGGVKITLSLDANVDLPAIVDPSWSTGTPPIRIRVGHTSTLLGTGEILVVGGEGAAGATTELLDVYRGLSHAGPPLAAARSAHTATVLLDGRVLLAGGSGLSSAELFDPRTHAFVSTGAMSRVRAGHSAARLSSGKVLVVGGGGDDDATAEIYDPASGTFAPTADRRTTRGGGSSVVLATGNVLFSDRRPGDSFPHAEIFDAATASWRTPLSQPVATDSATSRTLTRLRDGRVLLGITLGCHVVSETQCDGSTMLFDPALARFTDGPDFIHGRPGAGVALLPSGHVVFAGGAPSESIVDAERYEIDGATTLTSDGPMRAAHPRATATMVPGGDLFVIGGTQATVSRRTGTGALNATGSMIEAREGHVAVTLHDGRALLAGGSRLADLNETIASAEIYDPVARSFAREGAMSTPRIQHTMTVLASGKVLIAGGFSTAGGILATAEIYDPAAPAGGRFRTIGPMTTARTDHSATLLPSGHVLVTGGCAERSHPVVACKSGKALASAELFDPTAETFAALPSMRAARTAHGAVLLPTGKVLVVGGDTADLFDPLTRTFAAAAPPGATRDGSTARLLASGRVFVAGGPTLASDLYDPKIDTWSFSEPIPRQRPGMVWTSLPDGRVLSYGGRYQVDGLIDTLYMFDPLGTTTGAFIPAASSARAFATSVLVGTGDVLLSGGTPCWGACPGNPVDTALTYDDGAPESARPVLASVPPSVEPGARVTLTGSGFAFGPEGSSGTTASSPTNHPLAFWVADAGGAVIQGSILDFTDTSATWLVPSTALYGHGRLFVGVGGVLSRGKHVEIAPAKTAVACAFDAECATGFCVDGVCCDQRCGGECEGCSAARKTKGPDGECGPVPPGEDIAGLCFSQLGQTCGEGRECLTGFCVDGVCCDSSCTGACQACNLEATKGRCSPINEGACGAVCDGDHTLKKVGAPDLDCAPFKCEADRCKVVCASVRDCADPFVCSLEGQCVAPPAVSPASDTVWGCRAVAGRDVGSATPFGAVLAIVVAAVRRRRAISSKRP